MSDPLNQQLRWVETFAYQAGKPIRLMPTGTFKRGTRNFEITRADLEQMAANYDSGRPRWKVPLYFGHPTKENGDPPKQGNIAKVYVSDDETGRPALFGIPEYTDEALKAVEGGAYQYVSPGVLWSKNGSAYADEMGKSWDNVLEHVAFTNRPFFGENTAVFSADPAVMAETMADNSDAHLSAMRKAMEELMAAGKRIVDVAEGGWAEHLPENKRPKVEIELEIEDQDEQPEAEMASAETVTLATSAKADADRGNPDPTTGETGMDENKSTQGQTFSVSAEEFAALQVSKAEADARIAQLEADIKATKRAARLTEMKAQAESFSALSLPTDDLATRLLELEEASPELYSYFADALKTANGVAAKTDNFEQKVRENAQGEAVVETFDAAVDKILVDEFKNDATKAAEAMNVAAERFPELAAKYASTGR